MGGKGELDFVGGEPEGQPGSVSHWKEAVEMRRKRVEVWCKDSSGSRSVGDKKDNRASLVDLSGNGEGEGTVSISEDACGNVWERRSYHGSLVVFRAGRVRSVQPSFCRAER